MSAHTYAVLRIEAFAVATRYLELAAEIEGCDPILSGRCRAMAELGRVIAQSTELRIAELAEGNHD